LIGRRRGGIDAVLLRGRPTQPQAAIAATADNRQSPNPSAATGQQAVVVARRAEPIARELATDKIDVLSVPRISTPSYQFVKKWQLVRLSVSMIIGRDPPLITRPLTSPERE